MNFPLQISFKLLALSPQMAVVDAAGQSVLYVKQQMFKLKEAVKVYTNSDQNQLVYEMKADRILDFSANYTITDSSGRQLGAVGRKGMRSLWSVHYVVSNTQGQELFSIREANPWIKVVDGLLESVAIVNLFTGYFLHPAYILARPDGTQVMKVQKQAAFFEGKFAVEKLGQMSNDEENLGLLSSMMMLLLERSRG
ncbi:MAG TPA: hypothetical protein VGB55_03725 [Tepidisphaeraceae bacterium]